MLLVLLLAAGAWNTTPVTAASPDPRSVSEWIERIERAEGRYGERWSVLVKDLSSGSTIFQYDADRVLVPASNRKITTFVLALERFGPEHQFHTDLGLTKGGRTEEGWITSSLVMRSAGDPSFTRRHLRNQDPVDYLRGWISHLDTLGLTRFQGGFYIDASAFGTEQQIYPSIWDEANRHRGFAAIPTALTINENLIRVSADPSSSRHAPGRLKIYPSSASFEVINSTRTISGRARGLRAKFSPEGLVLEVGGSLGQRARTQVIHVPLARPLDLIEAVIEEALAEADITVQGGIHVITDPRQGEGLQMERVIARHRSPALPELLGTMMRDSDNFLAEQLWHAAAYRATGSGTRYDARRTEQEWLNRHGLSWIEPGHDGSGLSRMNSISAKGQVEVLSSIFNSPYGAYLIYSLPVSGKSGTLKRRSFGKHTKGRIYAKTGTLSGVSALSGFILDRQERPRWVFSLLGNAPRDTNGRLTVRQNQIMKLLVNKLDGREEVRPGQGSAKRRDPNIKVYVEQPS